MIYTATPVSWFSSNFTLTGHGHRAELCFNWVGEQGKTVIDGVECPIRKSGLLDPTWSLEVQGQVLSLAKKPSLFRTKMEIETAEGTVSLERGPMLSRSFFLKRGTELIASLKPTGLFTRKIEIELYVLDLDFPSLAFVCWLRLLLARREQQSQST